MLKFLLFFLSLIILAKPTYAQQLHIVCDFTNPSPIPPEKNAFEIVIPELKIGEQISIKDKKSHIMDAAIIKLDNAIIIAK